MPKFKKGDVVRVLADDPNIGLVYGSIGTVVDTDRNPNGGPGYAGRVWVDLPGIKSSWPNRNHLYPLLDQVELVSGLFGLDRSDTFSVTKKPEPVCPHCDLSWVKAAPEHVTKGPLVAGVWNDDQFGQMRLAANKQTWECRCWRCSRTWTHTESIIG